MAKKDENYVSGAEFQKHLINFFETNDKAVKEKLGIIFLKISKRILNKPCFINYTPDRKDDMVSDATYFMVKYMDRYDPDRGNPFAFFSQIAFNAFKQNINKIKKRNNMFVPLNYLDNVGEIIE